MGDLAVLELPKKKGSKASPKRRGARGMGTIWQPTYTVKLADGSVQKRKSNYYWISYHADNQRISENSNFTTKDGARQALKDRLAQISTGAFTDFQRYKDVTLEQIGKDLRAQYETKGRRTVKNVDLAFDRLEKHFGKDYPLPRLTPEKIETYRAARRDHDPKPSEPTIARELAALKAALRLAFKNDKLKKIPHIEMPDERDHIEDGEFSAAQMAALLPILPAHLGPLVRFLYRTGMRIEEPLGLKWTEVRLDLRTLRLPGRRTKNKEAKPLTLDGEVLEIIKGQRAMCDRNFPACEYVFPNTRGERMTYDQALRPFRVRCKRAGIKAGFTTWNGKPRQPGFHDLRRTFAREADRCGVPHSEIMRIAGWKTHAMLLRYLGANEDRMRNAFAQMDANFGKPR